MQIGITSSEWDFLYERDPHEVCVEFMIKNKYDILPLKGLDGSFNYFMVTDEWNHFDKIRKRHKSTLPKVKSDCDFLTLLKEFILNKEKYFLLYKGASIDGLISIVNFTYREIYKRLYNELAELEIKMADWLFKELNEAEVVDVLLKKNNSENSKSVLGQYLIDQKMGNDSHIKEYLYLSSMHSIIKGKKLYEKLGFTKPGWDEISDPLFVTRNSIAHPVKSLIREKIDFKRVLISLEASKRIIAKTAKALS